MYIFHFLLRSLEHVADDTIAHGQVQGRRSGEPHRGRTKLPPDQHALHGYAADRGADGLGRRIKPVAAGDGRIYHARPARPAQCSDSCTHARAASQFTEGVVFVVGGAGYVEYGNFKEWAAKTGRRVGYEGTEIWDPESFVSAPRDLGKAQA
jgi:hypothetical protein